jgi:hypothetical protein
VFQRRLAFARRLVHRAIVRADVRSLTATQPRNHTHTAQQYDAKYGQYAKRQMIIMLGVFTLRSIMHTARNTDAWWFALLGITLWTIPALLSRVQRFSVLTRWRLAAVAAFIAVNWHLTVTVYGYDYVQGLVQE